jgi:general secretion pathway protein J
MKAGVSKEAAGQRGFTLLEILVAVALLSIILAAVYSTFELSHRAMEGMDESLLALQESRTVMDILARELESASYDPVRKNTSFTLEDRDIYGKQASRLSFTTLSSVVPGLSIVSYYVEEKEGKQVLLKKIKAAHLEADTPGAELIEGIDSFTVEVREAGKWVKTWDTAQILRRPAEVRVTLTMNIKGRPVTLYETLRPRIGNAV